MTNPTCRQIDHAELGRRLYSQRHHWREIPTAIITATKLARAMCDEQTSLTEDDGRAPYNSVMAVDAVLALVATSAMFLEQLVAESIDYGDSGLPALAVPSKAPHGEEVSA